MNRVVRDHYPLANLPEDLRADLPNESDVRIVIEPAERRRGYTLAELLEIKKHIVPCTDDPVQRVRSVRDEWD